MIDYYIDKKGVYRNNENGHKLRRLQLIQVLHPDDWEERVKEVKREYAKKYYETHRLDVLERQSKYYEQHKDRYQQQFKDRYHQKIASQ